MAQALMFMLLLKANNLIFKLAILNRIMPLKLYNTLTRKKEIFVPIKKGQIGMYGCGPTVYNFVHIGNHRTNILYDLIRKSLKFLGYKVKYVMNITDVDDKTIRESKKEGVSLSEFTRKYERIFFEDIDSLNIQKADYILRATESIDEMIILIKKLLEKGYAYKTSDGIYFSVGRFKNYGKLAQIKKIKKTKERVDKDEYDKENIRDFALWKFHTDGDGDVFWETEIGKGRPGWHIECSAMSMKILGESFDIHTGGADLIFPHHTNEIAQSESATGKPFAKYWIHGGMLTMKEKMSKSLGNVIYLKNLIEKGYFPLDYRYFCLTKLYRLPLKFLWNNLDSAKNSLQKLKNIISEISDDKKQNKKYLKEFENAISDDLNMPKALRVLWKLVRDEKAEGKIQAIKKMDEVFGLDLLKKEKVETPADIRKLVEERENLRRKKEWARADNLRRKINEKGFIVEDVGEESRVKRV